MKGAGGVTTIDRDGRIVRAVAGGGNVLVINL
jgi:hypothetical protein